MKNLLKLSALAAVFVTTATFASADSLTLGSWGTTNQPNPGVNNTSMTFVDTGFPPGSIIAFAGSGKLAGLINQGGLGLPVTTTVDILNPTFGGTWGPALPNSFWISYGQTGPDTPQGLQPGNTFSPDGSYFFQTTFQLSSIANVAGSLNIMADDSVAVFLNGHLERYGAFLGPTDPLTDGHCSDGIPSCLLPTVVNLNAADFNTGTNTLTFQVLQIGSVDLGMDFNGTVTSGAPTVPEPSTLLMLGTGLIGSAGAMFRRMRRS